MELATTLEGRVFRCAWGQDELSSTQGSHRDSYIRQPPPPPLSPSYGVPELQREREQTTLLHTSSNYGCPHLCLEVSSGFFGGHDVVDDFGVELKHAHGEFLRLAFFPARNDRFGAQPNREGIDLRQRNFKTAQADALLFFVHMYARVMTMPTECLSIPQGGLHNDHVRALHPSIYRTRGSSSLHQGCGPQHHPHSSLVYSCSRSRRAGDGRTPHVSSFLFCGSPRK